MKEPKKSTEKHPLHVAKDLAEQLRATGEQLNSSSAEFLKVDAETALTFSRLALETDDPEKKERNRKNARRAYDTILHLRGNVSFTHSQEAYLREKMGRLKSDLERLGEQFEPA
jgi:hypothetical protein